MSKSSSSLLLIAANLVPFFGVAFFEWDMLALLLLYWTESVIIGALNVLKIMTCQNDDVTDGMVQPLNQPVAEEGSQDLYRLSAHGLKFILVPFFIVHYGGFCFGHVSLVIAIFGNGSSLNPRVAAALTDLWQGPFWIAVAAIFGSHLFSFFRNYIGSDEFKRVSLFSLMFQPYGRIVVMHVTILVGAGLAMAFGSPWPMLLILIAGKILIDMHLHENERNKLAAA